jgi:hypothetical protein
MTINAQVAMEAAAMTIAPVANLEAMEEAMTTAMA